MRFLKFTLKKVIYVANVNEEDAITGTNDYIEKVREYFRGLGMEDRVLEFDVSSATVDLAAEAVGVEGARICKTMSFKDGDDGCLYLSHFFGMFLRISSRWSHTI